MFIHYVEKDSAIFNASSGGSWVEYDLSAFSVPSSTDTNPIVAEILMSNESVTSSRWGGARSVGSSLDRRFILHDAEGDGREFLSILVPVNSDGKVELYAGNTADVDFFLIGYWDGGTYVEYKDVFQASGDNTWINYELGSDFADTVAEIVITNDNGAASLHTGGVREVGSSRSRYHTICFPETGDDHVTMHVNTSGANGTIQIYASSSGDIDFTAIGRWSTPPGTYNEDFTDVGTVSANSVWQQIDISVASGNVVEMIIEHREEDSQRTLGVREVESTKSRNWNIRQTNAGASDAAADMIRAFVNITSGTHIELYHNARLQDHRFMNIGYWDDFGTIPIAFSGNAPLIAIGHSGYNVLQEADYPSGLMLFTTSSLPVESGSASLVTTGPAGGDRSLFVHGYEPFDTSGSHPSGMSMRIGDGHEPISASGDLYVLGPEPISASGDLFVMGPLPSSGEATLYTRAGEFESFTLYNYAYDDYFGLMSGFIKGPEFIVSSGSFDYPHDINDFEYPYGAPSPTLYTLPHETISGTCSLYVGPVPIDENWILYLKTEDSSITDTTDFFTQGFEATSGINQFHNTTSLYLDATHAVYPYTAGGTEEWTMFLKAQSGNLTNDEAWTLFLKADTTTLGTGLLYTYGHASGQPPHGNEFNDSVNLVCSVDPDDRWRIGYIPFNSDADPWTLFIKGEPGHFGIFDLYISGYAPIAYSASGDLFVQGLFGAESGTVSLYLMGISGSINNGPGGLTLYLDAITQVYNIRSPVFYTHGY